MTQRHTTTATENRGQRKGREQFTYQTHVGSVGTHPQQTPDAVTLGETKPPRAQENATPPQSGLPTLLKSRSNNETRRSKIDPPLFEGERKALFAPPDDACPFRFRRALNTAQDHERGHERVQGESLEALDTNGDDLGRPRLTSLSTESSW